MCNCKKMCRIAKLKLFLANNHCYSFFIVPQINLSLLFVVVRSIVALVLANLI